MDPITGLMVALSFIGMTGYGISNTDKPYLPKGQDLKLQYVCTSSGGSITGIYEDKENPKKGMIWTWKNSSDKEPGGSTYYSDMGSKDPNNQVFKVNNGRFILNSSNLENDSKFVRDSGANRKIPVKCAKVDDEMIKKAQEIARQQKTEEGHSAFKDAAASPKRDSGTGFANDKNTDASGKK